MQLAAMVFAVVQQMAVKMKQRLKGERKPEIRHVYTGANEVARRNPDYGKSDAIETNGFAQQRGIPGEPPLPVVFADENRGRGGQL
jgi:hypothetical protein